jgi:calcineurin-like phosphoesterase family protein
MNNDFFSSDTHFGHKNIMVYEPATRPHASPEEMDEWMIERWNSIVPPNGTVWHLGDFSFWYSREKIHEILARLNGRIHLVLGNHDEMIIDNRAEFTGHESQAPWIGKFASIRDYREIRINKQKIVLFHFPIAIWNKCHRGSFHLYGHVHGNYPGMGRGKTMDVGWDTSDLGEEWVPGPISFDQVKATLDQREIVVLDHHDPLSNRDQD